MIGQSFSSVKPDTDYGLLAGSENRVHRQTAAGNDERSFRQASDAADRRELADWSNLNRVTWKGAETRVEKIRKSVESADGGNKNEGQ